MAASLSHGSYSAAVVQWGWQAVGHTVCTRTVVGGSLQMPAAYLTSTWSCKTGSRTHTAPWQRLSAKCSKRGLQTTMQVSQKQGG